MLNFSTDTTNLYNYVYNYNPNTCMYIVDLLTFIPQSEHNNS